MTYLSPLDFPVIRIEDVWALMRHQITPLKPRRLPLADAGGHVLAEEIIASVPLPSFPTARVDGYAVRVEDGPMPRRVVGEQRAGQEPWVQVGPGEAVWVTTGAVVPDGADAVVPVEQVDEEGSGRVRPRGLVTRGMYVRPVGYDVQPGDRLLSPGVRLRSGEVALLASVGVSKVSVYPRPRVAVLATGDELQEPGTPLKPGHIWVGNRYGLLTAARDVGGVPVDMGIVPDTPEVLRSAIRESVRRADVVISTGGLSMGDADWTRDVLAEMGTVYVGRTTARPVQSAMFVMVEDTPVIALPGSPVAAWVGFFVLGWPAIRLRAGEQGWSPPRVFVRVPQEVNLGEREAFVPARVLYRDGELWAEMLPRGVRSSVRAQVLLYISPQFIHTRPGHMVEAWWLP